MIDKSSVPVGTGDTVLAAIAEELAQRGPTMDFAVVSNPEFLKEGAAVADFMRPDRVVIGADEERAILLMRSLYARFVRNRDRLLVMDRRSAAVTKCFASATTFTPRPSRCGAWPTSPTPTTCARRPVAWSWPS